MAAYKFSSHNILILNTVQFYCQSHIFRSDLWKIKSSIFIQIWLCEELQLFVYSLSCVLDYII